MKKIILIISIAILASCGEFQYDRYLGLWETKNSNGNIEAINISKDGDTYTLHRNPITNTSYKGDADPALRLETVARSLQVQSNLESVIRLDKEGQGITLDGKTYFKISMERLTEMQTAHQQETVAKNFSRKECKDHKSTYKQERNALKKDPSFNDQERKIFLANLKHQFAESSRAIANCSI